jgi:putative ABC transport system permease protein
MLRDVRYTVRTLLKSPSFTILAVLTLAVGIGGSTAIYTLLERVVLDPLPYPDSDRLVRLKSQVPGVEPGAEWELSAGEFFYFRERARSLAGIGAYQRMTATIQTPAGPERTRVAMVSASALPLLGARAATGRVISRTDDQPGAPPVAMLSYGFWQRRFGGDRQVIGQPLSISGTDVAAEIVGVMAPGTDLPYEPGMETTIQSDVWIPMRLNPEGPFHNNHVIPMVARLQPGVTAEQAQREIDVLTARLPDALPNVYSAAFFNRYGFRTAVYPLKDYVVGDVARNLWMLFGAAGLVLLIACANIANLFLVRFEGRRRELALRAALGAGRVAVARLFIAESVGLALLGAIIGFVLSAWSIRLLVWLAPPTIPRLGNLGVDGSVVLFTFAVALVTAAVLAAFPILRPQRAVAMGGLTEGGPSMTAGRERQRLRSALIANQVALALTLTIGGMLLMDSFRRLHAADTGIHPEGVLTVQLSLPADRYSEQEESWRFFKSVLERVRALPGVVAAGASTVLPFTGGYGCTVQGFEDTKVHARLEAAGITTCAGQEPTTPGYFEALGIRLLRGRLSTDADNDRPATGAVIVSQAFADRFWPGEDPIGKGVGPSGRRDQTFYRVVGVVSDVYATSIDGEKGVAIYYPIVPIPDTRGLSPASDIRLVVKTDRSSPATLFSAIREVVHQADPLVALANADEMQAIVDRSMSHVGFVMVLLGIAAALALCLAGLGLYGTISYLVARRTNEIGVRMALGAAPAQVERLVMAGSIPVVLTGLGLGTLVALLLAGVLRSLLYGVEPTQPVIYLAALLLLAAVATLASWIPARRAAWLDPTMALRET